MALSLDDFVQITINLSNPGLTRQGFGTPMVLSNTGNAWTTPELTRSYEKGGFASDFPAGTVENAILSAIFAQPSPPTKVVVGKGSKIPTMVRTVKVSVATAGAVYLVKIWSNGTLWTASYTAQGGDSAIVIAHALALQMTPAAWQNTHGYLVGDRVLNDSGKLYQCTVAGTSAGAVGPTGTGAAIVDGGVTWEYVVTPNFTAANGGTDTVTATGAQAGNWFALEPIASGDQAAVSNLMVLTDTTTDPSGHVSSDLDLLLNADKTWYALVLAFKSSAILSTSGTGVSAWCATNNRLLVASVSDTACATDAFVNGTDVLHTLTGQGSKYTGPQWHPRDYEFLDACTDGYFLAIDPGSDNWRLKGLTGPTPVNLTTTQETNLKARRANFYATLGGQNLLAGDGMVESTLYGFIDTVRNIDWYKTNLQVDLVDLLVSNNKLPNTTAGREVIALAIQARNEIGIKKGVISPDPLDPLNPQAPIMAPYTVTVPPVTDEDSFDSSTRQLSGLATAFKLAEPINGMGVQANITQ